MPTSNDGNIRTLEQSIKDCVIGPNGTGPPKSNDNNIRTLEQSIKDCIVGPSGTSGSDPPKSNEDHIIPPAPPAGRTGGPHSISASGPSEQGRQEQAGTTGVTASVLSEQGRQEQAGTTGVTTPGPLASTTPVKDSTLDGEGDPNKAAFKATTPIEDSMTKAASNAS